MIASVLRCTTTHAHIAAFLVWAMADLLRGRDSERIIHHFDRVWLIRTDPGEHCITVRPLDH